MKKETLCITCAKCGKECSYWKGSKYTKPIKGWLALETLKEGYKGRMFNSHLVLKCPLYELDECFRGNNGTIL